MSEPARLLALWLGVVSLAALLLFAWDKLMAKRKRRRVPETALWAAAILGGGVGACLGQRLFHHKTKKGTFPVGLPLLAVLQLALLLWAILR